MENRPQSQQPERLRDIISRAKSRVDNLVSVGELITKVLDDNESVFREGLSSERKSPEWNEAFDTAVNIYRNYRERATELEELMEFLQKHPEMTPEKWDDLIRYYRIIKKADLAMTEKMKERFGRDSW